MASQTFLQKAYLAYFGRPVDITGATAFANATEQQVLNAFAASPESLALYGPTFGAAQINAIYTVLFGRTAEPAGLAFWLNQVSSGLLNPAGVALAILNGAQNADAIAVNNKLITSVQFTSFIDTTAEILGYSGDAAAASARAFLSTVTTQVPSSTAIETAVKTATTLGAAISALTLTTGLDHLTGTANADTFTANVVQNSLGQQVNTLGSGDTLNGGAGIDTLTAKVTLGAFAGSISQGGIFGAPIQPITSSIEKVTFEALNAVILNSPTNTNVVINAKDMVGVTTIGSLHSDANLIIQNLTTLNDAGVARPLNDLTITYAYSGNRDTRWSESNESVYFDQDYIINSQARNFTKPSIGFNFLNEDQYDAAFKAAGALAPLPNAIMPTVNVDSLFPLAGVFFTRFNFKLNGVDFNLQPNLEKGSTAPTLISPTIANVTVDGIKTYAGLLAQVNLALNELKRVNPSNLALQSVVATLGNSFKADVSPDATIGQRFGTTLLLTVDATIGALPGKELNTLTSDLSQVEEDKISATDNVDPTYPNSNRFERIDQTLPVLSTERLPINVILEKVGDGGDGGALVIGSMFKDGNNTYSDLYKGKGIPQFGITVVGGSDLPSSLSSLASTGNNLEVVTVTTNAAQTGTFASLKIGNSNTVTPLGNLPGVVNRADNVFTPTFNNTNALKDVKTFDASAFKGDLTLFAGLTSEVTAKYFTLTDAAPATAAADNVQFTYTGGTGNDYINLWLDNANLSRAGTTAREDFVLNVNGGAGNDEIVVQIGNGRADAFGNAQPDNWYINSKINANMTISGGAGNDTIRKLGAGDFFINGNEGNDTIYADNTGGKAIYVFNVADGDVAAPGNQYPINNLQSQTAASVSAVNANLTVTFKGLSSVVVGIANSNGSLTNVTIDDLSVNQAIKAAINLDPVLSKLLLAEDGPGRTLVVRSLIDGLDAGSPDLAVTFSTAPLNAAQLAATTVPTLFVASPALADGYVTTNFAQFGVFGGNSPVAGVAQTFTATFAGDEVGGNTTITFDGVTVLLQAAPGDIPGATDDGATLAAEFVAKYMAAANEAATTYNATAIGNVVTFTSELTGVRPVLTSANFVIVDGGGPDAPPVTVTVGATNQGVTAVAGFNEIVGSNSTSPSDNVITGGTGNDVIVLGTTTGATELLASNDTVRYEAGAFGNDTVVNFGARNSVDAGTPAVVAATEVFKATFAGTEVGSNTTVTFDGVTVTLAANTGGAALATDFVTKYNLQPTTTFVASSTADVVTFTSKLAGDRPDVVTSDFLIVDNSNISADNTTPVTITAAAPTTQGATAAPAVAPVIDADLFDFRLLGGDMDALFTNFNNTNDKSIVVVAGTSTAGAVGTFFGDSATASTHVYVGYDVATNIGTVYSVSDAAGTGVGLASVAILVGTINLDGTPWATLTAANFV